jgi:hypothetical protein
MTDAALQNLLFSRELACNKGLHIAEHKTGWLRVVEEH